MRSPNDDDIGSLFGTPPVVFAELLGPNHAVGSANPAFFDVVGTGGGMGVPLAVLLPELGEQGVVGVLDEVYRTGRPGTAPDAKVRRAGPDAAREMSFDFTCEPRRERDGQVVGVTLLGVETAAARQIRQLAREQRHALLEQIARDAPLEDVLHGMATVIEQLRPGVLVSILLVDDEGRHLRHGAAPSLPEFFNQAADGIPVAEGVGSCGTAAHRREAFVVSDIANHPYWEGPREVALRAGLAACWSTPIQAADGRLLGTFGAYHRTPTAPQEADLALCAIFARTAALAIERHHIQRARARAEAQERAARQDLAFVLDASTRIGRTLDYRGSLRRLAELSVPTLAPVSEVDVIQDRRLCRIATVAADPRHRELLAAHPPFYPEDGLVPRVLAGGETEIARRVPSAPGPWAELGVTGYVCIPLSWRGRTFGALTLLATEEHPLRERTVALAEELARRAASSAHNARQYTERVQLARDLQAGLLLPEPPAIPGVEVATHYQPAGEGVDVGGDFYDVFPLADDRWGFMIGDVCGRGAPAATTTGLVRHTARAVARLVGRPPEVVDAVNTALLDSAVQEASAFVTLVYGQLERRGDHLAVELVRAGHVAPLVRRAGRRVEELTGDGMLLGIGPQPVGDSEHFTLSPGETLFLVTDGITEARAQDGGLFGDDRLARALAEPADGSGAQELLDHVVAAVERFTGKDVLTDDDRAALVITAR